jgi:teichoic acid transport system ATP-binding protein
MSENHKPISVDIQNLTKVYKIYNKQVDRLKESLSPTKRKYGSDFYALKNLSLQVKRGEIYGIMGKNGSGKSTLLKIITGVLTATTGTVTIGGKIAALLELGAGFNSEYTGLENIFLNGMMIGFNREEMEMKLDTIIEFADIGDYINQPVKTYSSGMFARLAFAISINVDPDILIVDEALSVGDYFFQAKCYKKFEEFKSKGKTILFVSHDMSSILKYCDKVLLLNKGERIAEGAAGEIVDLYKKVMAKGVEPEALDNSSSSNNPDQYLKNYLTLNPNCNEYGNRKATIVDFAIKTDENAIGNSVMKGQRFIIYMKISFQEKLESPIFAFTIRDIKGTDLIGTNTMLEGKSLKEAMTGSQVECEFEQEMNLQGGNYLVSLGCTAYEQDELIVYHRLYDVCMIQVISDKNTIGYYDCNSEIRIKTIGE